MYVSQSNTSNPQSVLILRTPSPGHPENDCSANDVPAIPGLLVYGWIIPKRCLMATDQAMVAFRRCVQFAPILTRVHYISATSHLKYHTNVWFRNAHRKAAGMYAEQSPATAVRVNQTRTSDSAGRSSSEPSSRWRVWRCCSSCEICQELTGRARRFILTTPMQVLRTSDAAACQSVWGVTRSPIAR